MRGTRGQQAKSSGENESEEFNLAEIVQQVKALSSQILSLQEENQRLHGELRGRNAVAGIIPEREPSNLVLPAEQENIGVSSSIADVLTASSMKIPALRRLESIRKFYLNYEEYCHICPAVVVKKMQQLVRRELLVQVAAVNGESEANLLAFDSAEFLRALKRVIAVGVN